MEYTEIFKAVKKMKICSRKKYIFLIFAKNIDCGYTLELPRPGGSNECHNLCFGAKIRKIGMPLHTPVLPYRIGYKGVFISRTCFPDVI